MECNKDEAARAKEIAVKKFSEKDIVGAKKFALKAQNLFPGLEGLHQLLATFEVYSSAEKKINGETDWYGVVGVDPFADEDTIRKHYRRLALTLHPDKNKSVGADGAFKILSEAWSCLSDRSKRTAYDQKRNLSGMRQKVPTANPSVPASSNGFHGFTNINIPNSRNQQSSIHCKTNLGNPNVTDQQNAPRPNSTMAAPRPSKSNTFWTVCSRCRMQYEYLKKYLNHNLLCPNCREAFKAVEMPAPSNGFTPWPSNQQGQNTMNKNTNAPTNQPFSAPNVGSVGSSGIESFRANIKSGAFSKYGGSRGKQASPSPAAQAAQAAKAAKAACAALSRQAACSSQLQSDNSKRVREEAQAASLKEEGLRKKVHAPKKAGAGLASGSSAAVSSSVHKGERPVKKRRIDGKEMANQIAVGNRGISMGNSQKAETERVSVSGPKRSNSTRELSPLELRNMLMKKARMDISQKLNEWRTAAASKNPDNLDTVSVEKGEKEKETGKAVENCVTFEANKSRESLDTKNRGQATKSAPAVVDDVTDAEGTETKSMIVPDPDFHDFDMDRSEESFTENQVWAAYDDDDGMPRYYAMVHSVISLKPFKVRISWLNSKSNSELAPLNWVGSGFPKTCGDLRKGKHVVNNSLNSFSHKVQWTKGARGAIQIYPKKGDVWALYRNWSPDWNELTPDEEIHKYDMVEVLEDYNEERGVTVSPLVKVAGFKTVFHKHLDPSKFITIRREELFRFSHQVPSYLLTGQEAPNAPKSCRELDPAATPLELLTVITEAADEKRETGEIGKVDH